MAKRKLTLSSPLMNAAGTLGFAPTPGGPFNLSQLGAFITNPISETPRKPAQGVRFVPFAGGFLLHTGYPSPGFRQVMQRYAGRWSRSPLPVIVHLISPTGADELFRMVSRLESLEGVTGIEIGFPPDIQATAAQALIQAAIGELPVIVRLPTERAIELIPALVDLDIVAVSLAPTRGSLLTQEQRWVRGRLYGPALLAQALMTIQIIASQGTAVIGAGGVYRQQDAKAMLAAGALGVQLDAVIWRGGWCFEDETNMPA